MNSIKYSILVPLYNKKEYLFKFFSSLMHQTFDNYEVLVVDDCSIDGSYEYLLDNYSNVEKFRIIKNLYNCGLGYTRNVLIDNSRGDYVLFVDPDDYIELDLLNEIDKEIDDVDILRFQNVIEPVSLNRKEQEKGKNKYRYGCEPVKNISGEQALLLWCLGERKINTFPWTYVIKKDLYKNVYYPNLNCLEDFAVTPYLIAKAKKIKAISYVGYHYLLYDNSLSSKNSYDVNKLDILYDVVQLAIKNINNTDINEDAKQLYIDDVIHRYDIRKEKYNQLIKKV